MKSERKEPILVEPYRLCLSCVLNGKEINMISAALWKRDHKGQEWSQGYQ